jgi:hypothetical protein
MRVSIAVGTVLMVVLLLVGCSVATPPAPVVNQPAPAPGEPAVGSRLAPGLYEQPDGSVQAVGTLEWSDLEGGFWTVIGGTEATGDVGKVVAVLANGAEFQSELEPLKGRAVFVDGTRSDGASTRMAGPEITVTKVTAADDGTPGPAE